MAVRKKIPDCTAAELRALKLKFDNPDSFVICPRCEKEIIYKELGDGIADPILVECRTKGCISEKFV